MDMAKKKPVLKALKTKAILLRMTQEDHDLFKARADKDGRSLSTWILRQLKSLPKS